MLHGQSCSWQVRLLLTSEYMVYSGRPGSTVQQQVCCKSHAVCRWVEGELLHFGSNNPMIHGAELGFVWCVPNERRYLILLSRIDLDDPRLNT